MKCRDCPCNIDNGFILEEICKDENLRFKGWQLKSDLGIHSQTAKKLVREGKLKIRKLKDEEGRIYFRVYLVSENKNSLKTAKCKEKNRINLIMKNKNNLIFNFYV